MRYRFRPPHFLSSSCLPNFLASFRTPPIRGRQLRELPPLCRCRLGKRKCQIRQVRQSRLELPLVDSGGLRYDPASRADCRKIRRDFSRFVLGNGVFRHDGKFVDDFRNARIGSNPCGADQNEAGRHSRSRRDLGAFAEIARKRKDPG
jgi:hypothetical protein